MYFAYFDFRANTRLIFIRGLTECCCDESLIVACHSAESTQRCSAAVAARRDCSLMMSCSTDNVKVRAVSPWWLVSAMINGEFRSAGAGLALV